MYIHWQPLIFRRLRVLIFFLTKFPFEPIFDLQLLWIPQHILPPLQTRVLETEPFVDTNPVDKVSLSVDT